MSGYSGYSMSNNAIAAYNSGERPMSKWTKSEIIEEIENTLDISLLNFDFDMLKKVKAKTLKEWLLYKSSWHHTSNHYNKTDFYSIDFDKLEGATEKDVKNLLNKKEENTVEEKINCLCKYLVWSGTKKRPKATEAEEKGYIQGNWFYSESGVKKSIKANGFMIVKYL